jgi:glucose 1-dehydrogenase
MLEDLKGKTALVTGGARGIGRAISMSLAEAGCHVIVHTRRVSAETAVFADELSVRSGVACDAVAADFRAPGDVAPMFEAIDQLGLGLDILVNNAGFETTFAAEDMPFEAWEAVLQVNLNAPFQCSQQAARRMKAQGSGGVIINISSIHDTVPRKGLSHYCASKAALKMLGHCTALEWAEYGIRVVNVAPGAIETDMNREAIDNFGRDKFEHWIPAGRVGNTGDVAGMVRFLCSADTGYVTGTDIYIDGGYMRNLVRYDDRPGRG